MCERWVGGGTDYNILTPSFSDYSSTSFCWAAQPGSWGPKPSARSWFSLPRTSTRTLTRNPTQAVCGTWLYNFLTSTCFLWASQLHRIQPVHRSRWYPDIFDRMHLFLDWRLGRGPICYKWCGRVFSSSIDGKLIVTSMLMLKNILIFFRKDNWSAIVLTQ